MYSNIYDSKRPHDALIILSHLSFLKNIPSGPRRSPFSIPSYKAPARSPGTRSPPSLSNCQLARCACQGGIIVSLLVMAAAHCPRSTGFTCCHSHDRGISEGALPTTSNLGGANSLHAPTDSQIRQTSRSRIQHCQRRVWGEFRHHLRIIITSV